VIKYHITVSTFYIRSFYVCTQLEIGSALSWSQNVIIKSYFVTQVASLFVTVARFAESEPEGSISSESTREEGQSAMFSEK